MARRKLGREVKNREQNPRFLIVSEGEVTEQQYFDAVKRSRRVLSADFKFVPPGPTSPVEIVQRARDLRKEAQKDDAFDHIWCIFDVEAKVNQKSRPRLAEAMEMARVNGISVGLSNPCIELWILLHSVDCQTWIASHTCQQRCSKLQLISKKHIHKPDEVFANYAFARQCAINLEIKHDRDGTVNHEDRNPSSGVYRLVDLICEAFPPRS